MDKDQFVAFLDRAFDRLQEKQSKLQSEYRLNTYEEYSLDLDNQRLIFTSQKGGRKVFDVLVIGAWAPEAGSFLWGWADGTLNLETRQNSEKLKGLAVVTGLNIFQEERLDCDESMAVEMAVLSVDLIDALGLYRIPGKDFQRFLALEELLGE